VLLLAALALTGCETTAEKSAKLERAAKQREASAARHAAGVERALQITRPSTKIAVLSTTLLHDTEGTAAVVTLRNNSSTAQEAVPIGITVRDARGAPLYTNRAAGESAALTSASLIPAHGELTWIDDQIQTSGTPAAVTAEVGEGRPAAGSPPPVSIEGAHQIQEGGAGSGAEGTIVNHSAVGQAELVVYAVVRRGTRIVAAGRSVLSEAPAGASTRFQLFFVGNPAGGQLTVSAPPTSFG
jgi:PAS domain-containing protein